MTTDARAAAWLTAWDCLTEADRCRKASLDYTKDPETQAKYQDAMVDLYRQGELFAALANAPEAVGLICGVELERRRDAEVASRTASDLLRDYLADRKDTTE